MLTNEGKGENLPRVGDKKNVNLPLRSSNFTLPAFTLRVGNSNQLQLHVRRNISPEPFSRQSVQL